MENGLSFYDNLSDKYETPANFDVYDTTAQEIVKYCQDYASEKPKHIIDLCCGSGILTKRLRTAYPNAQIEGYDISEKMLDLAHSKKIPNVEFCKRDVNTLENVAGQADIITCNYGIHWLDREAIRMIANSLHPNGIFVCTLPGYTLGNIELSKGASNYVGNMLFKTILNEEAKCQEFSDRGYAKQILAVWKDCIEHTVIKKETYEAGLRLMYESVKSLCIDFESAENMVLGLISRGTFGSIFNSNSLDFTTEVIKAMDRKAEKYQNLTEENITQYLIFKKCRYEINV